MKRNSFKAVCRFIFKHYGISTVSHLMTNGGYVVPKCYVAWVSEGGPIVLTTDKEIAAKKGYTYISLV